MLGSIGSLFFVLVVNFFLFRVLPGDPARTLGRERFKTPEQMAAFRHTYGLDQSLPQQFVTFLKNTFTGQLGISLRYRVPVVRPDPGADVADGAAGRDVDDPGHGDRRLHRHHAAAGTAAARSTGRRPASTLTLYSMPEWWLGLLLIAAFAVGHRAAARASSRPAACTPSASTRAASRACWTPPGT